MKHGSNSRRGRSRGNGKRHSSPRNQTFDSNGPEGKVRGTPQQILDKYLSLARDAASAGEHIAAEGFYQFAEHYYRILNADQQARQRAAEQQQNADDNADENNAGEQKAEGQRGNDTADRSDDESRSASDDDNGSTRKERGNGRRRGGGDRKPAKAHEGNAPDGEKGGADDAPSADAAAEEAETPVAETVAPA